jgi:hypothetical protein
MPVLSSGLSLAISKDHIMPRTGIGFVHLKVIFGFGCLMKIPFRHSLLATS